MTPNPTITINGTHERRTVPTKNGDRVIHFQNATFESPQTRFRMEHEIGGPDDALPVGTVLEWDVAADVEKGKYGPELARKRTLIKRDAKPAARVA